MSGSKAGLCTIACLLLFAVPAAGQQPDSGPPDSDSTPLLREDDGELIGVIPGTDMTRDEFRARAMVQLDAVALSALCYHITNGIYPTVLYELYNSDAWNLDINNMFNGRPVEAVHFIPEPKDLTNAPILGLAFPFELESLPTPTPNLVGDGEPGDGNGLPGGFDPSALAGVFGDNEPGPLRVSPRAISNYDPGDIFYYVDEDLLQLVVFAPDGTYVEHVDEVPSANWRSQLGVKVAIVPRPGDLHAAAVLFFTETLLPQYYNLVLFMSDAETLLLNTLSTMGAQERITLTQELDIVMLNPYTKQPIVLAEEYSRGDFIEPDPQKPVPLHLCLRDGRVLSLTDLVGTMESLDTEPPKEEKPKSRPPLGGRK